MRSSELPSQPDEHHVPGAHLYHPLSLAAWVLVAFNDFVLKPHWPGVLSGKLSDVGICFGLPIFIVSALEWMAFAGQQAGLWSWQGGRHRAEFACVVTLAYFSAMQLSDTFVAIHLGVMHALFPGQFVVTQDPSDLITLPMTGLAWWFLKQRTRSKDTPGIDEAAR